MQPNEKPVTPEEAQAIDAACRESFDCFARRAFRIIMPGTEYEYSWHIGFVAEHLQAVYNGEIKRLIINMPPRTLKTYLTSVAFPAWYLGKKPSTKFITTSFKHERAIEMAQNCRHIIKDKWYQACFPNTRIDPNQDQKHNFHTTQRGKYYSSAISSVTGSGADVLIADDILNPDEAISETVRNTTNGTVRNTLFSRFNDPRTGAFILIMHRLHEDDPTGNLLQDGGWTQLKLPAEARKELTVSFKRRTKTMQAGELLHPTRLTRDILDRLQLDLTEYNYAGQYLQDPVPLGGGELKEGWFRYYGVGGVKPKEMNIVILVDPSAGIESNKKKKKTSDWTAMMVVGLAPDNNYYLLDMVRDRLNPTERVNMLFALHRRWNELGGKPPRCGYEEYGLAADIHYINQKMETDSYRFNLIKLGGRMVKEDRIRRLIPDLQNSRWWFPQNLMYVDSEGRSFDLVRELVYSEAPSFPMARFDDMLDALSRIYEEDLQMFFPKPKSKSSTKIRDEMMMAEETSDWRGF